MEGILSGSLQLLFIAADVISVVIKIFVVVLHLSVAWEIFKILFETLFQ